MTRIAKIDAVVQRRRPSPEEMEQGFQGLRAWGPEGERIVEVHKRMIALLDEMFEKKRVKRRELRDGHLNAI
jgi:hypothetical protein